MIRVLLSGFSYDRVEFSMVRALHDSGVRLFAIVKPGSPAVALCESLGIPHVVHEFRNRFERAAVHLYRGLLREHEFDIVHCLSNRALSTALLATRGMACPPRIVAYRGTLGHLHWWDPTSRMSYLNPRVDAIICVSDAVRRYLKEEFGLPESRLEVIWKGHDPAWYSPAPRSAFAEFGIPADAVVAGFVGNIRPVKGVDVLLEAFRDIAPSENIHLVLIGEVRDRRIRRQIGRHPHVHFIGYRADAAQLAGACDIAVMPSIEREGLPKAILEAMAQGIPSVVSQVGGMPELVEDGRCGRVVPPRDADALRAAVRNLAQDAPLRLRFGAAARARIEGPFHVCHTVEKTLALYRRLVEGRPSVDVCPVVGLMHLK